MAERKSGKKPKKSIFDLKSFNGGKDSIDVSRNVDKYIYGRKFSQHDRIS